MRVLRFSPRAFRNLQPTTLDVDAPLVLFFGPNGQGKTNALEALGLLGSLRSFRSSRLVDTYPDGKATLDVRALVASEGQVRQFVYRGGEARQLVREERDVDAVTWLRSVRASWFTPADVDVVREEPAARRSLLDRTMLTLEPGYLIVARDFRRALDQKAALLRSGRATDPELDAIDATLAPLAARVTVFRHRTLGLVVEGFRRLYREIADGEDAEVRLIATLGEGDLGTLTDVALRRFAEVRSAEQQRRRVLIGPQRDDLHFSIGGRAARTTASQGQARSLVLAWKLSEVVSAKEAGEVPFFLLDDLGSELDARRTRNLVARLGELEAQVFVSSTDPKALTGLGRGMRVSVAHGALGQAPEGDSD